MCILWKCVYCILCTIVYCLLSKCVYVVKCVYFCLCILYIFHILLLVLPWHRVVYLRISPSVHVCTLKFSLDFKQLGFCASPVFLQTPDSRPRFPNEMQKKYFYLKRGLWTNEQQSRARIYQASQSAILVLSAENS